MSSPEAGDLDPFGALVKRSALQRDLVTAWLAKNIRADLVGRDQVLLVQLVGISKLQRLQEGVEALLGRGLAAESAILVLSQFELRLDIEYIGLDIARARKWMSHEDPRNSPWSVKHKIKSIYADSEPETKRHEDTFRMLSGVKHANPHYEMLAFDNVRVFADGRVRLGLGAARFDDAMHRAMGSLMMAFAVTQALKGLVLFADNPAAQIASTSRREATNWLSSAVAVQQRISAETVRQMKGMAADEAL